MNEQEYNIEVLCTSYSLERLKMQRQKLLCAPVIQKSPDVIDDVTIDVLDKAILCYDEERYKSIRDEMQRNRIKWGIT
ncbi:MAG: hypothetical protein NC548_43530 [Lachnospiraceae bacterium]|nr:hypothetical protein [Lachnospiraceae bacterium]